MGEYIVRTLVTYLVKADDRDEAGRVVAQDTEHPIFPTDVGACLSDRVVSIVEV